jgi:UDP-3-O-[3-hydroxymyristoyl] N-acetylglucosamine deacetylase
MNTCISQRTLKNVIRATGIGLHTAAQVHITLRPAAPDHGIVFVRTDLSPAVRLPARVDRVGNTNLATTLTNGDVRLSTVEHLLAAFAGLGIDNALVEVDAPELPIMDGSAGPFVFLIQAAGVASQAAPRRYYRVRQPVLVRDGDAWAELRPHAGYRVEYTLEYDHPVFHQHRKSASIELSPTAFIREISRARTFGFLSDYEGLVECNRVRGGSLGNAIVLDDCRILNEEGLRVGDEFVRHKILDAIGDLYLLGHGLIGAFTGFRSGHGLNRALLERFLDDREAWEIVTFTDHAELQGAFGRQMAEPIAEIA